MAVASFEADAAPLQLLLEQASKSASKTAIRMEGINMSYSKLLHWVRQIASALVASGIETQDRVAWLLPNCMEAVAVTSACYRIGAISVPINVRYASQEIAFMVEKVKAKMLFLRTASLDVLQEPGLQRLQVITIGSETSPDHTSWDEFEKRDGRISLRPVPSDHPALILFTSGTTGHPKGVVHSMRGCWEAIRTSADAFQLNNDDVVLVGKPITHAGGLHTQLLPALMVGGEAVLDMIPPPAKAVDLIQRFHVTTYAMLVGFLLDFVEFVEKDENVLEKLSSLRRVIGSGDCVPLEIQSRFLKLFGKPVVEGCGISEIGGYYAMQPIGKERPGSIGLPTRGTEVRLVDDKGNDVAPGLPGEVWLRTSSATLGYWEDPTTTAQLFQDGWLKTGDIAKRDEDGYIWFVGRRKLIIIRRGSNIAPAAIERVLALHPRVHSSVVVGVPDEQDGQVPVAWIVSKESPDAMSPHELEEHVSRHLAAYERPVHFWFRSELPLNSVGKFDRALLQSEAQSKQQLRHSLLAGAWVMCRPLITVYL